VPVQEQNNQQQKPRRAPFTFLKNEEMKEKMVSLKKTARHAGLLYLIIVIASLYGHMYVPLQIFVRGDAVGTANNILQNEFLFRSCIVAGLIEATAFLLLAHTLHRLFKGINDQQSRLMVALISIQIPVALVLAIVKFMALTIVRNEVLVTITPADTPAVAMMFLNTVRYSGTVLGIFGGLWLFPLGLLILKARFIPQTMGVLVLVAATGTLLYGLMGVLAPAYGSSPIPSFVFFILAEIPLMLWLLIKGTRDHISIAVVAEKNYPLANHLY
jgi:hypothetical protein